MTTTKAIRATRTIRTTLIPLTITMPDDDVDVRTLPPCPFTIAPRLKKALKRNVLFVDFADETEATRCKMLLHPAGASVQDELESSGQLVVRLRTICASTHLTAAGSVSLVRSTATLFARPPRKGRDAPRLTSVPCRHIDCVSTVHGATAVSEKSYALQIQCHDELKADSCAAINPVPRLGHFLTAVGMAPVSISTVYSCDPATKSPGNLGHPARRSDATRNLVLVG